jgi:hypothetical protein
MARTNKGKEKEGKESPQTLLSYFLPFTHSLTYPFSLLSYSYPHSYTFFGIRFDTLIVDDDHI